MTRLSAALLAATDKKFDALSRSVAELLRDRAVMIDKFSGQLDGITAVVAERLEPLRSETAVLREESRRDAERNRFND